MKHLKINLLKCYYCVCYKVNRINIIPMDLLSAGCDLAVGNIVCHESYQAGGCQLVFSLRDANYPTVNHHSF